MEEFKHVLVDVSDLAKRFCLYTKTKIGPTHIYLKKLGLQIKIHLK